MFIVADLVSLTGVSVFLFRFCVLADNQNWKKYLKCLNIFLISVSSLESPAFEYRLIMMSQNIMQALGLSIIAHWAICLRIFLATLAYLLTSKK